MNDIPWYFHPAFVGNVWALIGLIVGFYLGRKDSMRRAMHLNKDVCNQLDQCERDKKVLLAVLKERNDTPKT